jgi:hypothetical protein
VNHRFGERGSLLPGDCIEGLLIGAGESRVREQHANQQGIWMRLSVFDGQGHPSTRDVILTVQLFGTAPASRINGKPPVHMRSPK